MVTQPKMNTNQPPIPETTLNLNEAYLRKYFLAFKHIFHPSSQALLRLSGEESPMNFIVPAYQVLMSSVIDTLVKF